MPRRSTTPHSSPLVKLPDSLRFIDVERTHAVADDQAARAAEWDPGRQVDSEHDIRVITARRAKADARYLMIDEFDRRPDDPYTALDEWLIAGEDLAGPIAERLADHALMAEAIELLDERVFKIKPARDAPPGTSVREKMAELLAALRVDVPDARDPFRPQHLAPMGIVVKADSPPRPAPGLVALSTAAGPVNRLDRIRHVLRRPRPIRVAVIDTGIADLGNVMPHPGDPDQARTDGWLGGLTVDAANIDVLDDLPDDDELDDGAGHGTFIAGVIEQVAPRAVVTVYRALDSDGLGGEAAAATAMVRAAGQADILNLSFGTETVGDIEPLALTAAVEIIREKYPKVLLVAAAGNFGRDRPCWPAALKSVVAVGGLTRRMGPARWSSRGHWVDCSTIGEAVLSTFVNGTAKDDTTGEVFHYPVGGQGTNAWAVWSGTSFAAPQIVAAVANVCRWGETPLAAWQRLMHDRTHKRDFGRIVEILPPT
ncbi:MAG: S8/S53 family peptidase [Ilumatobacteraceae bacterium]